MFLKKSLSLLLIVAMLGGVMLLGGCGFRNKHTKIKEDSVADGLFMYYLETQKGDTDYYAIVGSNQDPCPETLYFPAYYKGKEVKYPFFSDMTFANNLFGHNLNGAKNVYFAHNSELKYGEQYAVGNIKKIPERMFIINNSDNSSFTSYCQRQPINVGTMRYFFYTTRAFKTFLTSDAIFKSDYKIIRKHGADGIYALQSANTSYMFNYAGSPNDDYFFINEFERGGKIENTPYEPQRVGYAFDGWYKETTCKTKWSFESDTLPTATYDEDGNVIDFIETKLYAKWIKK